MPEKIYLDTDQERKRNRIGHAVDAGPLGNHIIRPNRRPDGYKVVQKDSQSDRADAIQPKGDEIHNPPHKPRPFDISDGVDAPDGGLNGICEHDKEVFQRDLDGEAV